jgi:hypothetical protein
MQDKLDMPNVAEGACHSAYRKTAVKMDNKKLPFCKRKGQKEFLLR